MAFREMETATTPEWESVKTLCQRQGRKLNWVAAQLGMTYSGFYGWLHRYPGHADTTEKRSRLCAVLNVDVSAIWEPEPAPA